ncbi:MAG: ferritin [Candidatus Latescibacterota bacterium]
MISEKMQQALNEQVNAEFYSGYLYLSMAAWFESMNLNGFANWMRVQTQEELAHGMIFYNYINNRGGQVKLVAIDAPPVAWDAPRKAFEDAYAHEQIVTARINKLMDQAISESDHATAAFLQWFVTEQVEEELNASTIANQLKVSGESPNALFMLDREMAARVFTMPSPLLPA